MFLPSNMTLRPGDSGDFVTEMQRRLASRDFLSESSVNGVYDGLTTEAVRDFQSMNGLTVDGIAGPETLRRLNSFFGSSSWGGEEATTSENEDDKKNDLEMMGARYDEFMAGSGKSADEEAANKAAYHSLRDREDHPLDEYRSKTHDEKHREQGLWKEKDQKTELTREDLLLKLEKDHQNVRHAQMDQANVEKLGEVNKQIEITRDGVQARTLDRDLKEDIGKTIDQQALTRDQQLALQRDGTAIGQLPAGPLSVGQQATAQQTLAGQQAANGLVQSTDQLSVQRGQERPGQGQEIRLNQQQSQQQQQGVGLNGQAGGITPPSIGPGQQQQPQQGFGVQQARGNEFNHMSSGLTPANNNEMRHSMARTERQLDNNDREASRSAGRDLDDRGARYRGDVPAAQLGNLSPNQTPGAGERVREAARG